MMTSARVLHVSNISPFATKDQIQALFSYVGRIEEFKIYPSELVPVQSSQQPKFAYIKFEDERGVEVGQHLTNTVFLDRALVCVPSQTNAIPDEETALQSGGLLLPGQRQLPPHISNQVQDLGDGQMITTTDPNLAALGLPAYPPLPPTTEPAKVEEIRRTIYIGNLPKGCDGDELLNFINVCIGEVMYLRMAAGNDYLPCDYAYVEFSQQGSVPLALQNSDSLDFQGQPLRIQHSKVAIIKPQRKTADQALEEVEEAIKSGNDGRMTDIGRGYSPFQTGVSKNVGSRSPRSTKRSRSKSRSSSRSRRRSRSRTRKHTRSSSRSRRRDRSRSHSKRRSHSRDKERSTKKRSRSPRRRSSRDRDRESRSKKSKRERSRSTEKASKSSKRERSRERSKKEEKKDKETKKERKRSRSPKKEKDEAKSSKKSKRSSDESPKKAKREPQTPPSTRTNASDTTISSSTMETTISPEKSAKREIVEQDEESLRERLLERVKQKQQKD